MHQQALVAAGLKAQPGPWRLATLTHRVSVLSKVHQLQQWPNPADSTEVRQLLANARRAAHKRGERPAKKTAITRTELQAMLATCGPDLAGVRDRALLYFGFASGGRRRSEVAAATLAHLRALPEGGFVYHLDQGKTLQDGPQAGSVQTSRYWARPPPRCRPGWTRPSSPKGRCSAGSGAAGSVQR